MDDQTRRELAGSVVGLGGVGGAAALRHEGLNRAYPKKMKRPPFFQELKMLKEGTKGRRLYTAGMALGAVSAPGAVHSINQLATADVHPAANKRPVRKADEPKRHSFLREGADSVTESFNRSNTQLKAKTKKAPPAKLMVGNYLGGAAIGSLVGGGAHRLGTRLKMPGGVRAATAGMTATAAGALTLPLQSKIMNHVSQGKYEATPTGVRRVKTKPKRPSSAATQVEARASRGADQRRARAEIVPVGKRGEGTAARLNTRLMSAADRIEHRRRGKLVATGLRRAASDPGGFASQFVAKYYGEDMTHAQKRARVASITGVPFVADMAQAAQAGRMAPPELRKKTAALTYGGGQLGGVSGSVGGAYGAAALARRSKSFSAGTVKVDDAIAAGKAKARSTVGLKPKGTGPSRGARALKHAPESVQRGMARAVKPLAGHGKAAAVGSLALGALGGQAGSQTGYGAALNMEDRLRTKRSHSNQGARHGTRVAKRDASVGQTKRDQVKLRRAKEQSAALSMAGGVIGLSALGATIGSKIPHVPVRVRGHLGKFPVPALTVGAGLGGINAFKYADIQHKEAAARVKKGYLTSVTGAVVRRAPSARKGFVRQTRTRTGIKTASVRGSVG